jgi:copper homeostasis protein
MGVEKSARVLEISVENAERAMAAERGGATRIELCAELRVGGVTPGVGLMLKVRERVRVPIFAMVRPRGGDFVYSHEEFAEMERAIDVAASAGMDGVVLGILAVNGRVDVARTAMLVERARPMAVTFHRAFDASADLMEALEDVVATGATRLLTSGGAGTAGEGLLRVAELVKRARRRIVVMPGSGITAENVADIADVTGAREFHAGLSSVAGRGRAGDGKFEAEVRKLAEVLAGLG